MYVNYFFPKSLWPTMVYMKRKRTTRAMRLRLRDIRRENVWMICFIDTQYLQ